MSRLPLALGAIADVGTWARMYGWLGCVDERARLTVTWAGGWSYPESGPLPDDAVSGMWTSLTEADRQLVHAQALAIRAGHRPDPVRHEITPPNGPRMDVRCWMRPVGDEWPEGSFAAVGQVLRVDGVDTPPEALAASTRVLEHWLFEDDPTDLVMRGAVQGFLTAWSMHEQGDETVRAATRQDIAADLHDGPLQLQHLLMAQLDGALETAVSGGDPTEMIRQMRYTARRAVDELRVVVGELDPTAGRTADVSGELRRVVRVWLEDGATLGPVPACDVRIDRLAAPETVAVALRRVLAEALNNVTKHARARHVSVALVVEDSRVTLTVTDDGVGFTASARPVRLGEQRGVAGMRNRLGAMGGGVDVVSTPEAGSSLTAWVPR